MVTNRINGFIGMVFVKKYKAVFAGKDEVFA